MNFRSFSLILILLLNFIVKAAGQSLPIPGFTSKPDQVTEVSQPVLSLNGIWEFDPAPPARFWKSIRSKSLHTNKIEVPGEWYMQGFEVAKGIRAAYVKVIELPSDWKGNQIILKCDGLYSDAKVFVNGKEVGAHIGGFTPAEFNVTEAVKPGRKNELIIGIINESLADTLASATQYAAHSLGGIVRKIELFAVPSVHLGFLNVNTDLDEDFERAILTMDYQIVNSGIQSSQVQIKSELTPLTDDHLRVATSEKYETTVNGSSRVMDQLSVRVSHLKKWDPEHPNLYLLTIKVISDGRIVEVLTKRVGFREIEVVGNKVFVNGQQIKLRGWNRHEVHPLRGRSLTMAEWSADAHLFKEANLNYIRTSHYPPAEEFINLCDSIGFFVELESPLCWIGHGANEHWKKNDPHSEKLTGLIRQEVLETVAHYRNHPSILIWSMANESAWGPVWATVLEEVNQIDPTRPVSFHDQAYGGFNNFGSGNVQIANIHYPGPTGPDVARKFDRPLLFGEYAHLNTYNRQEIVTDPGVRDAWGRGLESMWENMYYSQGCLGGAIWSGIDDVFYLPSGKAVGYGEWGPIDGWRRPKPEYWHVKKIYSPIRVSVISVDVPAPGQDIEIPVENRHLFTNLREVEILWKIGDRKGKTISDAEPGRFGIIRIDPGVTLIGGEELELSFTSPQGFLIDQEVIQIGQETRKPAKLIENIDTQMVMQDRRVMLQSGDSRWVIDATTGLIAEASKDYREVITGGPRLQMLPLVTGPCDTEHSLEIEPLNNVCTGWKGRITGTGTDEKGPWVKTNGSYEEAELEMTYRLDVSGALSIKYSITSKLDINPRQIGLVFDIDKEFEILSWERKGQWTVYPDTHIGRIKGIAKPFPNGDSHQFVFGKKPNWPWEADLSPMGSNDFRATRDQLVWAELSNIIGEGLRVDAAGTTATRAWVGKNQIQLLVASFSTAGGDMFFSSHLKKERHPLKVGDVLSGTIKLSLK